MLQKVLLIILLVLTGASLFMVNKIYNRIEVKYEVPVQTPPSFIEETANMPKIWEGMPDLDDKKVYLSYDNSGSEFATEIYNKLTANGFSVYMPKADRNELKNDEETLKALKATDVFVIIYNQDYKANYITNQEFGAVIVEGKKIVSIIEERIPEVIKYTENIIFFDKESGEENKQFITDFKRFL